MTIRRTFGRTDRLRSRKDFKRVFDRRCSVADDVLVVYVDRGGSAASRLGLSVSKRIGGAVVRNRVKRLIREAFRQSRHELPVGIDVVCVARTAEEISVPRYADSLRRLVSRAVHRLGPGESDHG